MTTQVKSDSKLTVKHYNAALFLESARIPTFSNYMTDGVPSLKKEEGKAKGQSNPGAPIIRINNLEKGKGDEVNYDIFHQLSQKPVMGDKKLAGRGASLSSASDDLKIDQGRTMVESGGRMTRQRTMHDLRAVSRSLLTPYYGRLEDQLMLVHLAGARGSDDSADWIVPTADDPEFSEIMVNPVTPPTFDRHYYGGNATSLDTIDSADGFNLTSIDNLRLILDEMAYPLQPIRYKDDPQSEENPFYLFLATPRQWKDFFDSTSGDDFRTLQANATKRSAGWKNPLFMGDCIMWNNILIKKQRRRIRFNAGDVVDVCTDTANAATTQVQPGVNVERGLLLGAQALANAYGHAGDRGSMAFSWHEEETDHGNVREHSVAWMNGKKKIRFEGTDGRINDHGVMALDTYVSG